MYFQVIYSRNKSKPSPSFPTLPLPTCILNLSSYPSNWARCSLCSHALFDFLSYNSWLTSRWEKAKKADLSYVSPQNCVLHKPPCVSLARETNGKGSILSNTQWVHFISPLIFIILFVLFPEVDIFLYVYRPFASLVNFLHISSRSFTLWV